MSNFKTEISRNAIIDDSNLSAEEWQEKWLRESDRRYKENTRWSENTLKTYRSKLDNLKAKNSKSRNTKEIGDAFEEVITFLFEHSGIFAVCKNVKSATNEIDQVLKLTNQGEKLIDILGASMFGLPDNTRLALSECKNYSKKVGVTYLMKFYGLLKVSDVQLGFFFATNGITGREDSYEHGYGYIKTIRIIEKYENQNELYILPFSLKDLESIESAYDFFELVKAKKDSLQLSVLAQSLKTDETHPNENEVNNIIKLIDNNV